MKKLLFHCVLFYFLMFPAWAQEVTIAAGPALGIVNQQGTGPYQKILHQAALRSGIKLNEKFYPLKRAVETFKHKKSLAIYLMIDAFEDEISKNEILTTYPVGIYKLYIFTRKDKPAISSFKQLKGKSVGGVFGYEGSYQSLINNGITISYISDENAQLSKLNNGRIDAILGFLPDWLPYLAQLNYDTSFPVDIGYDYIVVWNIPQGQAFVDKISPILQQMKADGTLKKILAERYIDFDYKASKSFEWQPTKQKIPKKSPP